MAREIYDRVHTSPSGRSHEYLSRRFDAHYILIG